MAETVISVFGSSRAVPGQAKYESARALGRVLAQAGYTVANGGYGGTMRAVSQGAREAGGQVIGVTCTAWSSKPNPYITREISTHSLDERLDTLIELGAGYVVLPGGTGTLLELAKVWELRNKGFADPRKAIILLGDFWRPLVESMAADDAASGDAVTLTDEPERVPGLLKARS